MCVTAAAAAAAAATVNNNIENIKEKKTNVCVVTLRYNRSLNCYFTRRPIKSNGQIEKICSQIVFGMCVCSFLLYSVCLLLYFFFLDKLTIHPSLFFLHFHIFVVTVSVSLAPLIRCVYVGVVGAIYYSGCWSLYIVQFRSPSSFGKISCVLIALYV